LPIPEPVDSEFAPNLRFGAEPVVATNDGQVAHRRRALRYLLRAHLLTKPFEPYRADEELNYQIYLSCIVGLKAAPCACLVKQKPQTATVG